MIEQVLILSSDSTKSTAFDATNLYVSNKQFGTLDGLRDHCQHSNKIADRKIPLQKIHKLVYTEGAGNLTVSYTNEAGKNKNYYLTGLHPSTGNAWVQALVSAIGLRAGEGKDAKKHDFTRQYISLAGIFIFTPVIAWIASGPRTGRRSQLVKLTQDIGPMGICIIGGLFLLFVLFQMYRQSRKPGDQTTFTK